MNLKVNLTPEKAIKKYLQVSNAILEQNKLTPIELEVLLKLLIVAYNNQDLPKDKRDLITFHQSTKKKIKTELKISDASFNNIMTSLRKKKLIGKDTLNLNLPVKQSKLNISLEFNLIELTSNE